MFAHHVTTSSHVAVVYYLFFSSLRMSLTPSELSKARRAIELLSTLTSSTSTSQPSTAIISQPSTPNTSHHSTSVSVPNSSVPSKSQHSQRRSTAEGIISWGGGGGGGAWGGEEVTLLVVILGNGQPPF